MFKTLYFTIPSSGAAPTISVTPPLPLAGCVRFQLDLEIPDELFDVPMQKLAVTLDRPQQKSATIARKRQLDLSEDKVAERSEH